MYASGRACNDSIRPRVVQQAKETCHVYPESQRLLGSAGRLDHPDRPFLCQCQWQKMFVGRFQVVSIKDGGTGNGAVCQSLGLVLMVTAWPFTAGVPDARQLIRSANTVCELLGLFQLRPGSDFYRYSRRTGLEEEHEPPS